MRLRGSLVALLASALTIGAGAPDRPSISLDELYSVYAAGDFDVISREITTAGDCPADLAAAKRAIEPWHEDWTRTRAVFLLDLAITCRGLSLTSLAPILSAAATFVIQRPVPAGSLSPDVSFDVTWHLAALGLLESQRGYAVPLNRNPAPRRIFLDPFLEEVSYLGVLQKWFDWMHAPSAMDRFALARGIAFANLCCRSVTESPIDLSPIARDAPDYVDRMATWKKEVAEALKAFDRARHVTETRLEASVRGALLLLYRNQPDAALPWLNGLDDDPSDVALSYWIHAVRGRVLDLLDRQGDAEREYAAALRLSPEAVAVAEWRAVDLMKLHRAQDAVVQMTALRNASGSVKDPWTDINQGDFRLVTAWRDQLRGMMR